MSKKPRRTKLVAGILLTMIMVSTLCCAGIFMGITSVIKSSDVYTLSLKHVRAHPQVQEAVGQPMEPGTFVLGHVKLSGSGGTAALTYDVEGSKGRAAVEAVAIKAYGVWTFKRLVATPDKTNAEINVFPQLKTSSP